MHFGTFTGMVTISDEGNMFELEILGIRAMPPEKYERFNQLYFNNNSTDEEGNTYYINAEKATVDQLNPDKNEVTMEGVISIISLKNKVPIIIYAKNATYNKINNNTYFYNDINIDYLDKSIYAENLDLIFTEKVSKVYNNVILNSDNFNLYTDRILIDMISGDVKLGVINNSEKVKFIKK